MILNSRLASQPLPHDAYSRVPRLLIGFGFGLWVRVKRKRTSSPVWLLCVQECEPSSVALCGRVVLRFVIFGNAVLLRLSTTDASIIQQQWSLLRKPVCSGFVPVGKTDLQAHASGCMHAARVVQLTISDRSNACQLIAGPSRGCNTTVL